MTPSPQHPSPRHNARTAARRSWRFALLAAVASAALVLSPLTLQAEADDQVPETDPTATAAPTDAPTPATSDEPSTEATSDPTSDESPSAPTDEPTTEPTTEPTKAPTNAESEDPVKPGQDIGGSTDLAPLQCNTVYALQGSGSRNLWSLNTGNGTLTSVGTFSGVSGTGNLNALGITADGSKAYGVIPNSTGTGRTVYVHDRASDTTSVAGAGVADAKTTHGAVNPAVNPGADTFYYYGGMTGDILDIYGFNATTGSSIGRVASGDISNGGGNGDWAFDSQGRLYVVAGDTSNNVISVVDQALPTTTQATPLDISATEIATSDAAAAINGIAFGGDGYLYIASGARVYKINPSSGDDEADFALSTTGSVDLASCAVPSTLELRKNFPDGRAVATHQATLSISGGGIPTPVTASTTGTEIGIQGDPTETAGPVLALNGTTYTISESGTGTAAASYTASWACVNTTNSSTLGSGTGTSGTVTVPAGLATASVMCTFTNNLRRLDAGDAPTSFGTTIATNGPQHVLVGYNSTARTSSLMLGSQVDDELDGVPSAATTGDDVAGVDDEDALPSLTLTPGATTASATVPVVNTTGAAATLYGWIDANGNGSFQVGEAATAAVPNGATSAVLNWSGLTAVVDGAQPVVRLRLTSATLTDTAGTAALDERSQGAAPDGEVEDSLASAATVLPDDCANPFVETFGAGLGRGQLPAGQTTYTFAATGAVNDGSYALVPGIDTTYGGWWHTGPDHTPGDTNGRAMLVNADFVAGKFFSKTFTGLQVGSTYDFSAWITNANNASSAILPNIKFRVVDPVSGTVLSTFDTGTLANQTSLIWTRYGLPFTATQSTVRLELVNNAAGGGGNDLALDDVGISPVCEHGDAPDSYGTLLASAGPVHGKGAPHLGATVDYEGDGLPTSAANGDDTAGIDDEDGVTFNPALGYPNPTIRTGIDPVTLLPVQNTVRVNASAAGFASAWVDWNEDGDFADAGERVADAQAVTAGNNDLTFPGAANPADIRTYVRVRYSTDAASLHQPTGSAPDGEVEDYQVLVERLIVPSACTPVSQPFYAMTFKVPLAADETTATVRYRDVTVVGGRAVDMFVSAGGAFAVSSFDASGDDAAWNVNGSSTLDYTFYLAGTTTPVQVNGVWGVDDMDSGESTSYLTNQIAGYAITPGSKVSVTTGLNSQSQPYTRFSGTVSGNSVPESRYQVWFQGRSTLSASWGGGTNSGFTIDGDTDLSVPPSCEDYGDAPDVSYKTLLASNGPRHAINLGLRLGADVEFDGDGQPTAAADGDDTNRIDDEDGVAPITVTKGVPSTITVNATNTTAAASTLAGWIDLDKSGTFDSNERSVVSIPAGSPAADYQLAFAPSTTSQPTYARFRLFPGIVADPLPTGAATAGEVEDYPVTVLNQSLTVAKSSNATASSKPGDTVTYTVTLTNTGSGAYTAGNPARLVDDLTGVLDDGTYQADAAATVDGSAVGSPTYTEPRISWSGPLAAGKSVVVTYSVVLQGGGDGHVRNTAFAPLTPTPGPTPDCSTPGPVPCDTELFELPKLTISKTANRTALPSVGQTIIYTVTVTNTGLGDFTAAHPATFADDLSAVLDDTLAPTPANITATRGTATFNTPNLSWSGTLPAGQTATITYTLTYTGAGDQQLDNSACIPATEAMDPADICRTVSVPGSGLRHHKTVDPASGTSVDEGQVLTYTLTFENVGPIAATVDTIDDLSDVLDDAQLVGTPVAGPGLTAAVSGTDLEITGSVPAGQSRTVTYQVQVRPYAQQGDHELENVLACEPGEPAGCAPETTSNPVRHLVLTKTSDATVDSKPGDLVTYTVTATNDGTGDWTTSDPATLVDDLTGVLDDATYDGTTTVSSGATTYAAPRLRWTGALAHGDTVTIEYTVTLTGGGDGNVDNVVWSPGPGVPGPTPDCATSQLPCAEHEFDLPKLTITKTSNRAQLPAAGQKITYTVTVTNPGPGDYTAAHLATFTDNLIDVLDDATFDTGSETATFGTVALNGTDLEWSGALTAGQSATVTYTLTYQASGNLIVDNHACIPVTEANNPANACRTVHTPGSGLRHFKSVDPANGTPVSAGQVLTYTLTFENVGSAPATVDTFDDLSDVADDAVLDTGSITADTGLTATPNGAGDRIDIDGIVPAGDTLTVTYQVTVKPYADQGDHLITNALACELGDPLPCDPTSTTNPVRHLTLTKTSDATADSKPGDTVSYTVRLVNDGAGDYTAADPATLVDDLTGVLDDATFNGVANASAGPAPTYAAPRITWAGPLASGAEVRVTYEVVLKGGGDGNVDNVAWAPPDPTDPGPTPNCAAPATTFPCDGESYDLPKLVIAKDADRTELSATGQVVTYTIVVTNPGPGDYTAGHPASFLDNLSDVVDDADVDPLSVNASTGSVSFLSPLLAWSGELSAGQSAVITFTATYRATGDHVLDNTACVPVAEAQVPANACDSAHVVGSMLTHAKSVSPASGTPVSVGQTLTYILEFSNPGAVPATVDTSDDLSDVLDDATLVPGSVTAGGGLNAIVNGNSLDVTGVVQPLETRIVTYQVTVRPFAQQGDHVLANALACEPGDPLPCDPETTSNPVAHLVIDKSSNRTVDSKPGDTITYTVTATNDGPGDFTAAAPASVVDDLTGVLDDADYGNDATANRPATPTYAAPRITWVGALASSDTVTITYTVVLKGGGDGVVRNVAWQPVDPGNPGPTPDCALTTRPCDTVSYDLPKLTVAKSASLANLPATGQTITYTVVVTNPGPGDYTAAHPATLSDDLSDVLDDATVNSVSATVGTASITGSTLSWSGVLAATQSSTITYSFTYRATGDHALNNTACVPASEAQVPADACDTVSVPGSGLVHQKSVDPASGTAVEVGDVLTYTLTFDNTLGQAAATVDSSDDLTDVLDDATLVAGSVTPGGGLNATVTGNSLDVTGTVPAGETRTVTYQVTVRPFAQQGDHVITNALACEPGEPTPCTPETTTNPVAHLVIDKSSNRTADSKPGDTITYTITATNDGLGDFTAGDPASVVDDLTGVLDDANYGNNAASNRGAAPTYAAPRIKWVGALIHGDTVTITYTVVLKGGGDGVVRNVAWQPVDPGNPGPTPDCAVTTRPCDTVSYDLPKLTITKAANRTELTATGQVVTYTVVVTNPGPGNYTAGHLASFNDDLSDVLDDATVGSVGATVGTATIAGTTLSWSGVLAATQSATITYQATYRATGDHVLDNVACVPGSEVAPNAPSCAVVRVIGSALTHTKSVSPASGTPVSVGDVLTYTLTFQNVGAVPATVNTSDDLSDVLDDASLVPGSVTAGGGLNAIVNGNSLDVTGVVQPLETRTVTYQVTVRPFAQQGDHVLANALACEPGDPLPCDPETTSNPVAHLVIDKSSNRTVDNKPGDTITYTVTATNDGPGDFTAAAPASVVDDLTGVLDDADYGNDATANRPATPTYAAPRITWVGALASNDTVTITYTVVLKGGGDGVVRNVAWQPVDPGNPGPTPDCAVTTRPCDTVSYDLPKLVITKDANRTELSATGQVVTYTIVVTNPGPGDYTAGHVASFSDNLSDVVDDAEIDPLSITTSSGTTSFLSPLLVWTGVLTAGQSATITYQATYRATGNHVLDNTACVPVSEAQVPADACDSAHVVGSSLTHAKSVSPASGTAVEVGDVLTYTLTFTNTGTVPADVNTSDDLSDVLDDADLVAGSVTPGGGLNATVTGNSLDVTGTVPAGATRTVTYQVTVKPFAQQGDHVLANALACEPGDPLPCDPETTSNPVAHLVIDKSSNRTVDSKPGDTITYTVTATNDGPGDFTAAAPASVVDDLTGVLDDADYGNDATANRPATPTYAAPRITWVGALASNDTVTITYTVVLKGGGDGVVRNVAWQPVDPGNPGPTPDCAVTTRPCDTVSFDLPKLTVAKSASLANLPATGQTITYTVVVTNPGPGDYTAAHPATLSDDLSDVLDDATVNSVSATVGTASITGSTLSWSGVLAATQSSTITYSFTYRATGDHALNNTACVPASEAQVPADACDTVSVPGSGLVHQKSVDPVSGTAVEVGDVLTYTLTFDNTLGQAAATVDSSDDLTDVLDDATLVAGSVTPGGGLNATVNGNSLDVTGTVPAGETRTVTYQVTVRPFAQQGDHVITNALACEPGEPTPCTPETTTNPVRHVVLTKVKTSPVAPDTGDTVTYTLTVHNDGAGDWTAADPASVVDDLTDVLDDATWDDTATASAGSVSFTSPRLTWSGALAHGTTVTVTYGVTVTNQGDHQLANTASVTGCQLPECTPPTVVTPLPHVVPDKTSTPASGQPVQPGEVITYTLSWTNDGTAPGVVDSTDDLSGVLDDAVVVAEPTSSDPAVTATRTGSLLRVVGPIADGDTVTVTYAVKVKPAGQHGDNNLANVLTQDTPQVTCPPFPCTPVPPPGTQHTAGDLDDWKTVDPAAGTPVKPGSRLTYTLHFASTGTGPVEVDRVDDLSGVLDDATLVAGPTPSSPALTVTGPTAGRIAITGTLPAGASATVTYTVEVKHDGQRGDDQLGNFLLDPGQQPPASCSNGTPSAARPDCTLNGIRPLEFDLRLDKQVVSDQTVEVGDAVRYKLRVSNRGPDTAPAPIVLRDRLPAGLELVSARGRGWDCTVKKASDLVVCRRGVDLAAHKSAPAVLVVAKVATGASGQIVNKAKVKAAGDLSPANNQDSAPLSVAAAPVPELPHTGFRITVPRVRFDW